MRATKYILLMLAALAIVSCGGESGYTPKPAAYVRLTFPEHSYRHYDTVALPFAFEVADSAVITWKKNTAAEKWVDLEYPCYKAVVFLSYKALRDRADLAKQVDDSYEMLKTHYGIASGIDEQQYVDEEGRVYATVNRLNGKNVASTYQFWITDSARHFVHGSFYVDRTPNNDSLQPLLRYIQQDIDHLIETTKWR